MEGYPERKAIKDLENIESASSRTVTLSTQSELQHND